MKSPFLSIIIPVYNGETTIVRCLESIWSQGMPWDTYEVICVNDCSTDNTVSVIEEQQKVHANLRLYSNEENLRAGGSRNRGVREAKGEYILFIDADDYFHPGAVKKMMEYQMKHRLDILMYDFAREYEGLPSEKLVHEFPNHEVLTGEQFLLSNSVPFGPCKFFFKKSLMVEKNIFFEENVCCEDVDWTHRLVLNSTSVQYLPILLSHVVINDLSTTANEHRALKPVSDKFFASYRLMLFSDSYADSSLIQQCLKNVAACYYIEGLKYLAAVSAPYRDKVEVLKKYTRSDIPVSGWICKLCCFPRAYVLVTNLSAPIVRYLISIKRRLLKR